MITPFDLQQNPIAAVQEDEIAVLNFVRMLALIPLANAVWKVTSESNRRMMLQHLADEVTTGDPSGARFKRIRQVINEDFGTIDQFVSTCASEKNFDGEVPLILHPYIALYVDSSKGVRNARFSSEAFYRQYRDANRTA